MSQIKLLLSLTTNDNDYQLEQAVDAEKIARSLDVRLEIRYAQNDSIMQSQQILQAIQADASARPDGVIFEPVGGTALPQVARAAAMSKIAWAILNRDAEYTAELRQQYHVPVFGLTSDHEEIGRIQGRQIGALLPKGGTVLYIQGPSESLAAKHRTAGMYETKPSGIQIKLMKGHWTEESAHKVVHSWMRLSTSQETDIGLIAAQNDAMAMGARKAIQEVSNAEVRDRWMSLPFLGCDGMPKTGQVWVREGLLAATIVIPPNAGQAIQMVVKAIRTGQMPQERTFTMAESLPAVELLKANKARGTSA
jgi:ribose transport system substrate-binding protein